MSSFAGRFAGAVRRPLAWADARLNALYGWELNPLYHSGVLAASLFAVVVITGIYLLVFYRIGAPYASVVRITDDIVLGGFMRSLHRYASDAAVLAAVVHMFRMYAQRRSWGPRALAWVSGLVLLGVMLVCGWTGYVMVWDVQGEVIAREGARWMDLLPLFSEPISRTFVGERPVPNAFFFINLFAHAALPLGLGVVLWIHVSRLARPVLVPPRRLLWGAVGLLSLASVVLPVTMAPAADLLRLPGRAPYDVFFAFFLPLTRALPPLAVWLAGTAAALAIVMVPAWSRPKQGREPLPSVVDEQLCTGCEQCYLDCPYEAIEMVARDPADTRSALVGRVDAGLCTSCGICAGSCAPMGVGPAGRTGRDQLPRVGGFLAAHPARAREVVVVACDRGAGGVGALETIDGSPVYAVSCAGNLHSSVIEYFVRAGVGGVLVVTCPPRDCWNREGAKWLEQRLFHDREAELKPRVDRRRVRLAYAAEGERATVHAALAAFRAEVRRLEETAAEREIDLVRECEAEYAAAKAGIR
jgi:ferredoxin